MNIISISALLFSICQLVRSASNCIELMSGNSFGLFCPSYSGSLPLDIPTGKRYSKLQIESANFPYGGAVLSKVNFTSLESLTYLRITSSGIERIDPDAFFNLKQLTHLDLSKNRLTFIEPGTFRGLKLKKLILSGNSGLKLSSSAFSGAKIFNFVAKDCNFHSISFTLFKQSGTRHISLVNNRIRTLSEEFSVLIIPSDGSWGSVDLSNNSLVCDCGLLWLAQLLDKQRRYMDDASSELVSVRSPRYPRETTEEEVFKPMYRLNLTCSAPKHLVQQRFPLPGEFDCPAPQVTGIDIAIIGKLMETVQLTCHARGRPMPNVAWAFQQHNQEVHRIVKSPTQLPPWGGDQMMDVSIGLNVSLREFQARDFSCIAWSDLGLNKPVQVSPSQDNWLNESPSSSSSIVPRGPLPPEKAHRVGVRLSGLHIDNHEGLAELLQGSTTNDSAFDRSGELSAKGSTDFSPYQQLFIRRFTPLDLIGAIIGTFITTLILLCIITRCVPHCYRRKSHPSKHILLQYERKQVLTPFLKEENKNESDIVEQNKGQPQQQQQQQRQEQQSAYFGEAATTVGSGSGPAYWPVQDYAYSTHEYDVPGMTDPLAGAMPLSPHPMMGMSNATGTLVRRGRPMSTASLHPSAIQTPYLFPKAATSTTGLILPPVATVPPLGVVASPFLSYATVPQPPLPSQQPPVYFGHNHQLSLSALPNGQLVMTPTMSRNVNGAASQQFEEPEACVESSVTSCNSEKSATERLIGASGGVPPTQQHK
ncbi:Slit 1 protein [Echinococcus granulosus]|uniref:Leucine rich repeat containing protein 70 n=1 Tax=Echinococcus granulosus TaxID=6210 RepID=U6J3D5_ECHGR|nr:Slit 1 protein [Echinococcus granulosus]EUB63574.1 Slit 1 protein [Echinococcus granulosus]CDS16215.1 leucine rich repeat containing protein 70 [Echinococcus granulosus]